MHFLAISLSRVCLFCNMKLRADVPETQVVFVDASFFVSVVMEIIISVYSPYKKAPGVAGAFKQLTWLRSVSGDHRTTKAIIQAGSDDVDVLTDMWLSSNTEMKSFNLRHVGLLHRVTANVRRHYLKGLPGAGTCRPLGVKLRPRPAGAACQFYPRLC
jgi:hypothetical protein